MFLMAVDLTIYNNTSNNIKYINGSSFDKNKNKNKTSQNYVVTYLQQSRITSSSVNFGAPLNNRCI
jgi:hypothetical protein